MDFSFTEEQTLLRNVVQRFVQDRYTFEARSRVVAGDEGMSRGDWRQFAELGLLAAPFPEDYGGLGGSAIEVMIVMEEFGRGLVVEPYVQNVVLAGGLLLAGGSEEQKTEHLPPLLAGERLFAFAHGEVQARYDLADVTAKARRDGEGFVLDGAKTVVPGAPWADSLIVSARTAGDRNNANGISLFVVDRDSPGLSVRDYATWDGSRAAEVLLEGVRVGADALLGPEGGGLDLIETVADRAVAALCAEAVGCMGALNADTGEYCRTRKQFGLPIGSFQVVQHRLVDMYIAQEQSLSLTYLATLKLDAPAAERHKAASAAKVQVGQAGRFVGQQAVQLHGGMGMTEELRVGHYFRRLAAIDGLFGDVDHHLRRFAAAA